MARNVKIENKVESNYQMNVTLSGEEKIAALEREVQNLNADLDSMTQQYEAAAAAAERFKAAADSAAIESGLAALREELVMFKSTASEAAMEFDAFLRAARLTDTNDTGFEKFRGLFNQIEEGSKTAQQAIVEVKQAYASVIEENWSKNGGMFDAQQIQQFDATLTKLGTTLSEVLARVTEMQTQGVQINGEFASSGASVASTLQQIEAAARNMDDDLLGSYEAIAKLTSAMNEYASIDSGKLETIASTFRNMAKIGEGNFGGKSLSNLTEFFAQAQRLGDGSGSIRLNVSGFESLSGLKTSKTWGDHLTTLGTAVKALNVNKLQSVAAIDFSNLTNFKMSKSTADNLLNLTGAMKQIDQLNAKVKALSDAEAKAASTSKSNSIFAPDTERLNHVTAVLKEIDASMATVTASYKKMLTNDGASTQELDGLREKYIALQEAIDKVRTNKGTASDEDIAKIRQLQTETNQLIESINKRITAEKEAEAAKQKAAADKAAEDAKKEAQAQKEAAEALKQKAQAEKEAASAAKQAETEEMQRANALKQYQTLLSQINTAQRNYSAAANSSNASSRNAYENYKAQAAAVEDLMQKYRNGDITYKQFSAGIATASASVKASTDTLKANGDAAQSLSQRLSGLASKFSAWLSVSQVIMYSIRAIKDMVNASIELDDAMSQLKIVTNETDSTYQNFASNISKTAQQIGASTKDLVDATTTYARLGYDLNDSSVLAKYTGMLQQVGNIEAQDAQDAMTSMTKAFNLDIGDIESVMDRLVAVGNGAPISVSQIAEAMTNASSTMAAAGNDINQTIALMTAANTTLQNAARSSTGLRTITARIRKTKTELDDLGEAMSDSDYNNMIEALSKITLSDGTTTSVSLKDINGEYRNTYDILSDLAAIWDKLDSMSQAGIAEKLAGTRMQDVFFSIMNNWKEASNAMSLMEKSADTLQNSYDKYLETTTAHLQTFKSAFAQLGADTFQTGFLNDVIDLGTGLIHVVDGIMKVINAVGGLKTVLIGIGGIIATIKADAIMAFVTSLPGKIAKLASPITSLIGIISRIPAVYQSMTSGTAVAVQGTSRLSAALQGLGISASAAQLAIGALVAVVAAISLVHSAIEKAEQKARESAQNGYAEAEEKLQKFQSLEDAYIQATAARAAGDEMGFASAVASASEALEGKAAAFDSAAGSASTYLEYLKGIRDEELSGALDDAQNARIEAGKLLQGDAWSGWSGSKITVELNEQMTGVEDHMRALDIVNDKMSDYIDIGRNCQEIEPINFDSDHADANAIVDYYYALGDALAAMRAAEKESGEEGSITNSDLYTNMDSVYKDLTEDVKKYTDAKLDEQSIEWKQSNDIPTTIDGYIQMQDAILDAMGATGSYREAMKSLMDLDYSGFLNDIGYDKFKTVSEKFKELYGDASKEYDDWYLGLDDKEKQIVFDLMVTTDTADYTLDDWKSAIESYEVPEEDKISFSDLFTSDDDGSFKKTVDDYVSQMETLNSAKEKLADGSWTSKDFKDLVEAFPELATHADDLEPAIDAVMDSLTGIGSEAGEATGIMAVFENALAMCATDEDRAALEAYRDAILGIAQASEDSETTLEKMSKASTTLTKGISEMQSAISGQQNGKSIDVETFNSDALKDYRGALEMVNGTMQLNADKCKEIAKAKAEEQIAINNTNKAIEQSKYLENARQIEQYRQQLRDANFAQGETAESVQASINALVAENSAIAEACSQYDLLSASIREAIGEYQNWLNAQSSSDYGDMANDTVDAINKIRNTFTEGTDDFGNFGSRKFEAALDFIVPDSVDSTDLAAVESYMNDFKKYLTFDDKGNSTGLNIDQFLQDSVSKGLMSYSDDDGFQILGEQKMEDFADGLGLSMGVVQAMFDELQLKGAKFDWTDEAVKTVGDLAVEAGEAAEALRGMEGNEDLKIKMDVSDLSTAEEQISALDETIAEMESVKAKPGVDASEIDNANAVIQYCLTQKQLLSQPDVMRVDTSQVEGDISNAISLLQQFQAAQNELEMQAAVGADTSEAEANVQALAGEIAALPADTKLALSIDTTSVESIQSSIDGLTAEMMVTAGIDDTAITGYNPETKECSVIYNPETSLLPESFDSIDRTVNYVANTANLPSSFSTITRYVNYVKTGDVSVNGTAHAGGTARAGGDWGTAPGGETLVGELGREIVVDPRTGQWYTVGDNGAEFKDIPAGAIVFNHQQTEDLLAHGYVAGRARALVSGTAMVTGGYKPYKPSTGGGTNSGGNTGGSNYTPTSYSAPTTNNTSNNKHDTDDKDTEIIDWIEIAIDRIERAIKNAAVIADSAFQKLSKRLSSINDEISLTNDKIAMEQDAYNRYIKEANSVGLSSDLANKVKNGTIDITEYDKDTADKIKDYQKWYELALDCRDAIIELTDSLGELYQSKFNEVQKDYENQLSLLEHMTNAFNNSMDDIEARGYLATTKLYEAQQKVQQDSLVVLNKELQALTDRMSEGVNSGSIAEGSEAWYEMQQAINDVKEKIQETETEIINLGNSIREVNWSHFDYLQERISDVGEEAQFLIDLLGHSELFTDRGQLTDEGMATMGLYAEKYNIYMAQADKYAAEIQKLTRDIANDPNNTKLLERRQELIEAQRDAILAAEGEKDAIVDLVKDGIDRELSALKELIDTYNESLDSAKNLYDYQKKVKKQTKEIADLQKQLAAYANDTSDETRAKVQKLEVDLSSAIETLEETQYDRYISEQKKLLDDLYSEYEQVLNTRLDDVDALISDMIDTVNTNSGSISDTITTAAADVGYTLSKETRDIWANEGLAFSVVSKYGESITGGITSVKAVLDGIAANVASMIKKSDDTAKKTTDTTKPSTPTNDTGKKTTPTPTPTPTPKKEDTKFNDDVKRGIAAAIWIYGSRSGWGNDPERRQKLTAKFGATNAAAVQSYINAHANNGDLYKYWVSTGKSNLSKYYYSAFKTGGLADFTGPAWLDGTPSDPEIVLNADDSKNFMALKDAMREVANGTSPLSALFGGGHDSDIMDGLSKIAAIDTDVSGGIGDVTYNINIPIDHVEDYEDFMNHMRRDRQFEQLIQSMTVDRLVGGSKIAKNKFKW